MARDWEGTKEKKLICGKDAPLSSLGPSMKLVLMSGAMECFPPNAGTRNLHVSGSKDSVRTLGLQKCLIYSSSTYFQDFFPQATNMTDSPTF